MLARALPLCAALVLSGCADDLENNFPPAEEPTATPPVDEPSDPPIGTIALTDWVNKSGTNESENGECIGFTIEGTDTHFTAAGTEVAIGLPDGKVIELGPGERTVLSPNRILVGAPCVILGPSALDGQVVVVTRTGAEEVSDFYALALTPMTRVDLGTTTALGVSHANRLSEKREVDYFSFDGYRRMLAIFAEPLGALIQPVVVGFDKDFKVVMDGDRMALRDVQAVYTLDDPLELTGMVVDRERKGAPTGYEYNFSAAIFTSREITKFTHNADRVDDTMDAIALEGLYKGAFTDRTANYDPMDGAKTPTSMSQIPTATCVSQVREPGVKQMPIYGAGRDVVYRLTVPARTTAYVGFQSEGRKNGTPNPNGDGGDLVAYVTEIGADLSSGNEFPCIAGADRNGPFSTDALSVRNDADTAHDYLLVVDQYTDTPPDDAAFLLWIVFR